jgi:hypothetical protein
MSIFINQSHGWVFLALGAAGAVAVAFFYRRVPPSVSSRLRLLLAVLRTLALALLFVALVEPVLAVSRTLSERPVVAVLLDVSSSMSIPDGTAGETRGEEAVTLLNEVVLPRVARDTEVAVFGFASGVSEIDSDGGTFRSPGSFDGEVTDIGNALDLAGRELSGRNLGAVVVATDGANNRGPSPDGPGLGLGVPVFVLGVGSQEGVTDISIEDAVTNRISYTGERVPVAVTVKSTGFAGYETVVELAEDGVTLDTARMELSGAGGEERVTFGVTPTTPGVHRYTVSVPTAPGEMTGSNNSRSVVTTAVKGKLRCLLLASRPSWDYSFLRREFLADANVDLTSLVSVAGSERSPEGGDVSSLAELVEYDLVVLVDPDWSDPRPPADWLEAFVGDRGGGLLVLGTRAWPAAGLPGDILPVASEGASAPGGDVEAVLTHEGESAPVTRVVADRLDNAEVWSALPPLRSAVAGQLTARAGSDVLVEGRRQSGELVPLVVTRKFGAGNVMAITGDGLWRWKMAGPDEHDVYGRFAGNAARLLTARGELDRVVVSTDRDVYASGEDVRVSAQVYGGDFRIAADASVVVSVSTREGAAPVRTLTLEPDGDFHTGALGALEPGSYVLRASASVKGETVGTAEAQLVVDRFSLEDAEIRRRSALLTRLARESGGGYYTPETVETMPGHVPLEWTTRTRRTEIEVWNSPWLLLLAAGLLSSEWALRRKQGLP